MALIAVAADKGAPGVSTVALTLALTWPQDVLLAECDPAGADLPWRLQAESGHRLVQGTGVLSLASSLRGTVDGAGAGAGVVDGAGAVRVLDHAQRLDGGLPVLVGPVGPEQAEAIGSGWGRLAAQLAAVPGTDVIADCGRFLTPGSPVAAVLQAADLVLMVTRPSLTGVAHLRHGIGVVARVVNACGRGSGLNRIGVVVVDDHAAGRRGGPRQVDQVLTDTPGLGDVPVIGVLGWDPKAAAALAGTGWGAGLDRSTLLRTAATTARVAHRWTATTATSTQPGAAGHDAPEHGAAEGFAAGRGDDAAGQVVSRRSAVPDWTWQGRACGSDGPGVGPVGGPS